MIHQPHRGETSSGASRTSAANSVANGMHTHANSPRQLARISRMRYSLRTLLMLAGVGPPAIACLWFHGRLLLMVAVCITLFYLWVWLSLFLARIFAGLVASVMD
jgi:hypothetical protein